MKKFIVLAIILILVPSLSKSVFFSTQGANKTIVFISKYDSRSMDPETLDYYEKIRKKYNVFIIRDTDVAKNTQEWTFALENSDIIFLKNLNEEVLFNQTRGDFCKNLATAFEKSIGILFAGNSLINSGDLYGCIYTPEFNLATSWKNTELINDKISIETYHEILGNYEIKKYNLGEQKNIYPVISPKNGIILGRVEGDPDGNYPQPLYNYPVFVLWRGLKSNVISWGIETSKIGDCPNCLGWDLLYQFLDWLGDKKNVGFKLLTDKQKYYPGDRISIEVSAPVEIHNVKGNIIYPNGKVYSLIFEPKGENEWKSLYFLEEGDPTGDYIISAVVENMGNYKTIKVGIMEVNFNLKIDNSTETARIEIGLTDKKGSRIPNSTIDVTIIKPFGAVENFTFNGNYVNFVYNMSETGLYRIIIKGTDSQKRTEVLTKEFYFKVRPKIGFHEDNATLVVRQPGTINYILEITNLGQENLTNITIHKKGEIKEWIKMNITKFSLTPKNGTTLKFSIDIPNVPEGEYNGLLNITGDQGFREFQIIIKVDYLGDLQVIPQSYTEWMTFDQVKEVEFRLKNQGLGHLELKGIYISKDIENFIHISSFPKIIYPNGESKIRLLISTEGIKPEQIIKKVTGNIEIKTDLEMSDSIQLEINILSDISEEVEKYYPQLTQLEKEIISLDQGKTSQDLQQSSQKIREKIRNTKELYKNEQLQTSYEMYNSIGEDIKKLETEIANKKAEIEREETKKKIILWSFVSLIIIFLVAFLIYKERKNKIEYGWLYSKWKNSSR